METLDHVDCQKELEDEFPGEFIVAARALRYLELVERIGFRQVLKVDFKGYKNEDEAFFIYWDAKRGILLSFDTSNCRVNHGYLYYNWIPMDGEVSCSYRFADGVLVKYNDRILWVGRQSYSGRDIDEDIKNLDENGEFVVPWIIRPSLWLLHYKDKERERYSKIVDKEYELVNERRIAMLPKEIQAAIKGNRKIGDK